MAHTITSAEGGSPHTTLYVIIPPSPLFAAHWSFFVPDMLSYNEVSKRHEESSKGRRIHVSGDRLNGFALEIIRQYDVKQHRSVGTRKFPIAIIPRQHLQSSDDSTAEDNDSRYTHKQKDEDEGGGYVDNDPVDVFEQVCLSVEAPGPSLNKASDSLPGKKIKSEVKDCQWWIRQVVQVLLERGVLEPLPAGKMEEHQGDITSVVASLPVH